jgi:CheY-like chemotaxis protein/GAF domain-containing protein
VTPTILLVEDNPVTRKMLRVLLETEGYRVVEAGDAAAALEQVRAELPGLVLQDLLLPDMDGLELIGRLRATPGAACIPMIALSGFRGALERSLPVGFDDALVKPVEPARLVEVIRSYLPPPAPPEDIGQGRRVLVVNDDPAQLKLARLRLGLVGFRVTTASDGQSALEMAKKTPPDLVLSDVLMAGLDGFELCLAIRRDPDLSGLPVVLTSAHYDEQHDQRLAQRVGAQALVPRSPDFQELFAVIQSALAREPSPPEAPVSLLKEEHTTRVSQQLERQARANVDLVERSALQSAQLTILCSVAEALAKSTDLEEVLRDVLAACLEAGGISKGALYRADPQGRLVALAVGFRGSDREALEDLFGYPELLAQAVRGAIVTPAGSLAEGDAKALLERSGVCSAAIVPLVGHGDYLGALFLGANVVGLPEQDLVAFGRTMGAHIGQALALANTFDRMSDMAEASRVLSSSLDVGETLQSLARLASKRLCDVCEVSLLEADQTLRQAAVEHVDPAKAEIVRELRRRYPEPESRAVELAVARSGRSELLSDVTDTMRATFARDEEHLEMMRAIGARSVMIVPLVAHGRILGTIGFGSSRPGRRYSARDLLVAEDLGRRAASAIANALLYQQAQESNRAKDEFLAMVSHELRTPLTAILGWSQLLQCSDIAGDKRERGLDAIERNAVAQAQLVDDLLDVTRINSGKLRLDVRPVALAGVTRAALESAKPAVEARSIQVDCDLDGDVGLVMGDPNRLQQIVWNLLSNAIKFTPKGGRIAVTLAHVDSHVELSISDDGAGIEPRFLPHVFERFKQADGRITRVHGGLGLGLAICRHLVELHGGTIEARSDGLGLGSKFTCKIPLLAARYPPMVTPRSGHGAVQGGRSEEISKLKELKVLVVDDNKDTGDLLVTVLQSWGATATAVGSAAEALASIGAEIPDVLVSDIGMPGEDGYALIEKVRRLPPERGGRLPAVALTAYARAEDRKRALVAGYQVHLAKPVEPAELASAVANVASPRPYQSQ